MLRSRIPQITRDMFPAVELALRLGAEHVAGAAKDRVPVDTGKLRDAIHVERDGNLEFKVIAGDTETFYGHIVEHGGAHVGPRPFMVPALQASSARVLADVRQAIRKAAK
jgi:HK97 gp10 family phage protein